ncbi:hypothetical protein D9M72_502870 [compost metagenome]
MGIRAHAKEDHVEPGKRPRVLGTVIGHVRGMLGCSCFGQTACVVSGSVLRTVEVVRGAGFMHPFRVHGDVRQQRFMRLEGVAVAV